MIKDVNAYVRSCLFVCLPSISDEAESDRSLRSRGQPETPRNNTAPASIAFFTYRTRPEYPITMKQCTRAAGTYRASFEPILVILACLDEIIEL